MTHIKGAVAALAFAVLPNHVFGQHVVCVPPQPDPCIIKDCVLNDDRWRVTVELSGQISLGERKISRQELKEDAAAWAKTGTWPIVVSGRPGAKYAQVTAIVEMLRKAGVLTPVSCLSPPS